MAIQVSFSKVEQQSKTRKLPFLPRVGVVVEIGGRRLSIKGTPFLETFLNVREKGLSLANLRKVAAEELAEVDFPALKKSLATVKTAVRDNVKNIAESAAKATRPLKKAAPKAAAKKKKDGEAPVTIVKSEA